MFQRFTRFDGRLAGGAIVTLIALLGMQQPAAAQTEYTGGPGGPLVDANGLMPGLFTSNLVISGTGLTVAQINSVTLNNLTHTAIGDLEIALVNLDTTRVIVLTAPPEARNSNFNGAYTFTVNASLPTVDEATAGLSDTQDLPLGFYAASEYGGGFNNGERVDFSALDNTPLDGAWQLQIGDFFPGDTGALGSWSFNARTASVAVPEPSTLALLAPVALMGGVALRRRKRAAK